MKMHEKKLKKFKVYKTITNVLFILVLVFGILGLVVAGVTEGVLVSQGVDLATVLKTTVGQLGIGYDIPIDTIPYSLISIVIIYASIGIGLVAFLLKTLSKMFGNIVETRTPFHNDNIKKLYIKIKDFFTKKFQELYIQCYFTLKEILSFIEKLYLEIKVFFKKKFQKFRKGINSFGYYKYLPSLFGINNFYLSEKNLLLPFSSILKSNSFRLFNEFRTFS